MLLEECKALISEARIRQKISVEANSKLYELIYGEVLRLNKCKSHTVKSSRKYMWSRFLAEPDLANTYKANIATYLMDNVPGFKQDKTKRDEFSEGLFNLLYKEEL